MAAPMKRGSGGSGRRFNRKGGRRTQKPRVNFELKESDLLASKDIDFEGFGGLEEIHDYAIVRSKDTRSSLYKEYIPSKSENERKRKRTTNPPHVGVENVVPGENGDDGGNPAGMNKKQRLSTKSKVKNLRKKLKEKLSKIDSLRNNKISQKNVVTQKKDISQKKTTLTESKKSGKNVIKKISPAKESPTPTQDTKPVDMKAWQGLFVPDLVLKALSELGFSTPTPIQSLSLPASIRDCKDILGAAETGSGKTLAFGIPLLHHIIRIKELEPSVQRLFGLVLTPTRELAVQVKKHMELAAKYTGIKIVLVVGGMSELKQQRLLKRCPEIIVATPGRLWDIIKQGNDYMSTICQCPYLVIDETDRMVEQGHFAELDQILEMMKTGRKQTFIYSATLTMTNSGPQRKHSMKRYQNVTTNNKLEMIMEKVGISQKPKVIDLTSKNKMVETLVEAKISCSIQEKDQYLYYFLIQHPGRTIVFSNSISNIRRMVSIFTLLDCNPIPLHGSMHQHQRLKNLEKFSANSNGLLLTTDVAARGLDIPNVEHIIHYQIPKICEVYVHRSGRTARASKGGISIMLVGPEDVINFKKIMRSLKRDEDDMRTFPVQQNVLTAVKNRIQMAKSIDKTEHQFMKKKHNNDWFKNAAQELDVDLDPSELEDIGNDSEQKQQMNELNRMKKSLHALIKQPVVIKQVMFISAKKANVQSAEYTGKNAMKLVQNS